MSTSENVPESNSSLHASDFKRRVAAWSLAVVGALSTSAVVCLPPPAAWGYDEPATTKSKADDEPAKSAEEGFTREAFSKLIQEGKLDEAAAGLDAATAKSPTDSQLMNMQLQLASMYSRSNLDEAKKRLATLSQKLLALDALDLPAAMTLAQATSMRVQMDRELPYADQIATLDETIAKLDQAGEEASRASRMLLQTKIRVMVSADKFADAKSLLDTLVEQAKTGVDRAKPATVMAYTSAVMLYNDSLSDNYPVEAKAMMDQAEATLQASLNAEDASVQDYTAYIDLKMSQLGSLMYTDAKQCPPILADIEKLLEAAKTRFEGDALQALSMSERRLKSMKSGIETALLREELIGTQAPEIDSEYFVATKPVTMEDLRGKVVLLDFWAVWCGPCIATFPHLIEWNEKYADKGLVILGATSFYNYKWDEAAGKAVSAERGTEVAPDEELAMLEKFRESYKLQHGFFVNPKGSEYAKAFAVSGIPQAVLLDKEGKIQLIRVGSGPANAEAIQAKIEELLAK